ncbi:hypothetical protein D3C79_563660 [compost metagenome]
MRQNFAEQDALRDIFADRSGGVRAAVENGAVRQQQAERGIAVKREGVVKLAEIIDVQRRQHHAGKTAVRMV